MKIKLLGSELTKYLDVFKLVILKSGKFTLIPEIYSVFGEQYTAKFIDTFSGSTIRIPSKEVFEEAVMDVDIYVNLNRSNTQSMAEELAVRHDLRTDNVRDIYQRMCIWVKELDNIV